VVSFCEAIRPLCFVHRIVCPYCGRWWSAASRHVKFWGLRHSLWRVLCNYVLWDVTKLTFEGRADQRSGW